MFYRQPTWSGVLPCITYGKITHIEQTGGKDEFGVVYDIKDSETGEVTSHLIDEIYDDAQDARSDVLEHFSDHMRFESNQLSRNLQIIERNSNG